MIDRVVLPDIETLVEKVQTWKSVALIAVAYVVPSWRDAVELMQAGAVEYVRKTDDVAEVRSHLRRLVEASDSDREEESSGSCLSRMSQSK
jgi:DNA-binding NtrC family response regulator